MVQIKSSRPFAPSPLGCLGPASSQPWRSRAAADLRIAGGADVIADRSAGGAAAKAVGWTTAGRSQGVFGFNKGKIYYIVKAWLSALRDAFFWGISHIHTQCTYAIINSYY